MEKRQNCEICIQIFL